MATLSYKGLTGTEGTITINLATGTFTTAINAIAAIEVLSATYYDVSVERAPNINSVDLADSTILATAGVVDGDKLVCVAKQSTLTAAQRQVQRLDIAQSKRQNDPGGNDITAPYWRLLNVYDITLLPLPEGYSDASTVNPLQYSRPWTQGAVEAAYVPETLPEAVETASTTIDIWYDASDPYYFKPSTPYDGQDFTQWTDKSDYAHNANAIGGLPFRANYEANELNSLAVVRFDGDDGLSVNPISSMSGVPGYTMFFVSKMTATAGNPVMGMTNLGGLGIYYDSTAGRWAVSASNGSATSTKTNDATGFHVHAMIYDGTLTGNANRLKYYYDGAQETLTFTGTVGTTTLANTIYYIGNLNGARFFTGDMAEICMFNRALSAAELQYVYNYLEAKWNL